MLTRKWVYTPPPLSIGDHVIALSPHLRYLGVILDSRLSFGKHVETVAAKAATYASVLARLMPNVRVPGKWKRSPQLPSREPTALCLPCLGRNDKSLWKSEIQSPAAPKDSVSESNSGVPDNAALLIAGMPPVDLPWIGAGSRTECADHLKRAPPSHN